jgi:low temperature requirement protein LtrA
MSGLDVAKRVSWAELFYDLVFIYACIQVVQILAGSPHWIGMWQAWVIFTPFWWAWVGTSILSNVSDLDKVKDRMRLFAIGLATFLMTVAAPAAFDDRGLFFAIVYLSLRLLLLWWSVERFGLRPNPFSASALVVAPLLLASSFLPADLRRAAWTVLMVAELSTTWLFRRRLAFIQVNASHLLERFGLVIMIALGESLVAAAAMVTPDFAADKIAALGVNFLLVCGLWWVYFHFSHPAVEHRLRHASNQARVIRDILAYGHYGLICAIIAVAVGFKGIVVKPGSVLEPGKVWLLCGGVSMFLALFAMPRWGLSRRLIAVRAPAAAGSIVLGVVGGYLSGGVLASALATLLIGVALAETALRLHKPRPVKPTKTAAVADADRGPLAEAQPTPHSSG